MIIKSILDTDLYKFTTSYAYMKLFPQARGTFEFIDRDNTETPEDSIIEESIGDEIVLTLENGFSREVTFYERN